MSDWIDNTHRALRRCFHPVAALESLDGDGPFAVRLLGEDHVLFRGQQGWTVFPDRCPHRLAPLTAGAVVGGELRCGYHGWCFDGDGTCVDIPAIGPRTTRPPGARIEPAAEVTEAYGLVWVALDAPITAVPAVPEWGDPAYGIARLPVQEWSAGAAQITDNFLDVAHFPFMHTATIGDPDDVLVGDYDVRRSGWTFSATHRHKARLLDGSGTIVDRVMEFECTAPHHLRLRLDYGAHGATVLTFFHQPVDVDRTRLYIADLSTHRGAGQTSAESADEAIAFQLAVGAEDRAILEQFPQKAVPLSPGVEVNTRADRITVEYRRVLASLTEACTLG